MDTSVWISYLRDEETAATAGFEQLQQEDRPYGITSLIYQEVLQGAASPHKFAYLVDFMGAQRFYFPKDSISSYREAARIYFDCRRAGVTIRSAIDCLIARIAVENDLVLLHDDRDFERIKRVVPDLRLA